MASACTGNAEPKAAVTVTVTASPENIRIDESTDDGGPTPELSRGPWGEPLLIVDGRWLVGVNGDIPPGGIVFTPGEASDCLWRVSDLSGNILEDVAVTNSMGAGVSLQEGDVFESSGCNVWEFYENNTTNVSLLDALRAGAIKTREVGSPVLSGSYVVGEAIPSGLYAQRAKGANLGPCEFSVSYLANGRYFPERTFKTTNLGVRSTTHEVVELRKGDLFETKGCGVWQRYEYVK